MAFSGCHSSLSPFLRGLRLSRKAKKFLFWTLTLPRPAGVRSMKEEDRGRTMFDNRTYPRRSTDSSREAGKDKSEGHWQHFP